MLFLSALMWSFPLPCVSPPRKQKNIFMSPALWDPCIFLSRTILFTKPHWFDGLKLLYHLLNFAHFNFHSMYFFKYHRNFASHRILEMSHSLMKQNLSSMSNYSLPSVCLWEGVLPLCLDLLIFKRKKNLDHTWLSSQLNEVSIW